MIRHLQPSLPALLLGIAVGLPNVLLPSVLLGPCSVATAQQSVGQQAADQESEAGFVPLFDGRSLSGWEGNEAWFRIEQGAIVGGDLQQRIPHNYFLCTTQPFADFELRLQVKVVGEGANAGIQFRSHRVPDSQEVRGYQADVGGVGDRLVWGGLYDESRRRRFLAQPDAEKIAEVVKQDDWNDYRIRCVGPKIELYLNGVKTVDYTESDSSIERSGIIGLQIHSGPPTEAWYRNVRIKTL